MSAVPAAPPSASAEATAPLGLVRTFAARIGALCLVEIQRLRHDRSELYTRAIQPILWLVIFGQTFNRLHAIPTGGMPYIDFLAPGVLAQSALFISIFYGIQIIWERDAGMLAKLLVTPTPRTALISGKAFAAGVRALQPGRRRARGVGHARGRTDDEPAEARCRGARGVARDGVLLVPVDDDRRGRAQARRLMGIGQTITMPLFFASNALYPVALMPGWLRPSPRSTR